MLRSLASSALDFACGRQRNLKIPGAVLLTFDDGPDPEVTSAVLDRLRAFGARAIFFVVGSRLGKAPHLLARILKEGHLLGNHTFAHRLDRDPGPIAYYRDVQQCQRAIQELTGQQPRLFRAPMGRSSAGALLAPRLLNLKQVLWSADSADWRLRSREAALECAARLCTTVVPGDIVLLHDDNPWVVTVLDELLPHLRSQGVDLTNGVTAVSEDASIHPLLLARSLERRILGWQVPRVVPQIVRKLPHDTCAFTQGLAYHNGLLYESTGGEATSSLRVLDPRDGTLLRQRAVPEYFGEGIAIVNDRLYQLSWKSGRAGVFHVPSLEKIGEVEYSGEGWGLSACPEGLVMSDGTHRLRVRDERFQALREIRVRSNFVPLRRINDVAWAGDRIFANRWGRSELFEISASDGRVLRIWDCSALLAAAPGHTESVFNGVTYNPDRNTLYVTGKNWSRMFELAIPREENAAPSAAPSQTQE